MRDAKPLSRWDVVVGALTVEPDAPSADNTFPRSGTFAISASSWARAGAQDLNEHLFDRWRRRSRHLSTARARDGAHRPQVRL